ncbi:winged helix-turn-helix transcriptional regulator [Candidatus Woesearchaeota archaeon]|nr:winged helix-turn-helix transcriptional regulator [Candidatus Woesearchaeota archaeon]
MIIREQRITIIRVSRPRQHNVNDELRWLGHSLGLFTERDKDSSLYRLFVELIKSRRGNQLLTSDELAHRVGLSRGTVVHHLNKLLESGIVVSERNRYVLRVGNLEVLIEELRKDVRRTLDDLKAIAKQIDEELEL